MNALKIMALATILTSSTFQIANANTVETGCTYAHGHISITTEDITIHKGQEAKLPFSYRLTANPNGEFGYYVYYDSDICIADTCNHANWSNWINPSMGLNVQNKGEIKLGKIINTTGDYTSTYHIRTGTLNCEITATSIIHVV